MSELAKCKELVALDPEIPYMPKEEWEGRISKARSLMDANGIDGILTLSKASQIYYFGFPLAGIAGYPAVGIIPKDGPVTFIAEGILTGFVKSEGYAERALAFRGDTEAPTAIAPEPVKALAELLNDLGLNEKTVGVELGSFSWWTGLTVSEWDRLKDMLPAVKWVDYTESIFWPQRKIKSLWEQEVLRTLYKAVCKGYMKGIEIARAGIKESEVFNEMMKVWIEENIIGSQSDMVVTNFGRNLGVLGFEDIVLKDGDCMIFDGGPKYKHYSSDCQRAIWIGDPGAKAKKWAYAAEIAHIEVEEIMKPGVTLGSIWQKGHEVMARYIGDEIWENVRTPGWIGWVGHGVGLGLHEAPYIVENSNEKLEVGMVVNVEFPAFDVKNTKVYNFPEDTYIITEDGHDCLTNGLGPKGIYIKD